MLSVGVFLILRIIFCSVANKMFFVRCHIPYPAQAYHCPYAGRVGLRICQYVNLQDRKLILHRLVPRSEVFYWFLDRAFRLSTWPSLFGRRYLFCFLLPDRLFSAIFLRPLFFSSILLLIDRLFCRPLLLNFVAPWPPFLPPGLGCTLRGQAAVSSRSCRLLRLYRLGYGLRCSGSIFSDGPLSSRLARVPLAFLDHSHCRLRGSYMHRFLDCTFSCFLGRFMCRLPGRSVCRHIGRFVCRLPDRLLCRLLGRFLCHLPDR